MMEPKKTERTKILGIDVDPIRVDKAIHLTSHYLETHKFEYIAFANTKAALAGQNDEEFASFMAGAAMVLPGDNNIEEAVGLRHWIEQETSYQAEYFRRFLSRLNRQRGAAYLMMEKEEELIRLQKIFADKYEKIRVEAILWKDEENVDSMVNDINILAPEMLLICGDYGRIRNFLNEHGNKIYTGLCFCMDAFMTDEEPEYPAWVKEYHIQSLYTNFYKRPMKWMRDMVFKKRMKKY